MPVISSQTDSRTLEEIQEHIWKASVPLEIKLVPSESRLYDQSEPYVVSCPRLAYLPFLLPRLLDYFAEDLIADANSVPAGAGQFTFENVPLRWHLPVGLLYDIHILSVQDVVPEDGRLALKAQPFRLAVSFTTGSDSTQQLKMIAPSPSVVQDAFINSVKEADFLRSGSAKPIMSLSATDSKLLWSSTQENDLPTYARIHASLIPREAPMRNIPLRVYLPSIEEDSQQVGEVVEAKPTGTRGSIRVIQSQIPSYVTAAGTTAGQLRMPTPHQGTPQTLGTALHTLLPSLFPSRRTPILAKPLLHGAVMPMNAVLEEVASKACYADGWVNVVVAISP